LVVSALLCLFSAAPANVFAGILLDAELRLTYEDNVVGLLSDQQSGSGGTNGGMSGGTAGGAAITATSMAGTGSGKNRYPGTGSGTSQSPGDFSTTLFAEAGGYRDVGSDSAVFAKGFASSTSYVTYTDLNATIGGVSTGMNARFGDMLSARVSILGKAKRFGDSGRNSNAYGGVLSLKEKLGTSFWLREFGEYETNRADSSLFSYTGTTLGIGAGYALSGKALVALGYSYLVQQYDEPSGAEMKTQTASLSMARTVGEHWAVSGEYALQISRENTTGTSATNNIFSLALRYNY
jgi:hypothetical protein